MFWPSGLTNLSCCDDVLVFGVLVDSQTEDVISVFQVETLGSCQDRNRKHDVIINNKSMNRRRSG